MVVSTTYVIYVLWLLMAFPYWNPLYLVKSHTHLECPTQYHLNKGINRDKLQICYVISLLSIIIIITKLINLTKLIKIIFISKTKVNII